MVKTLRVFSSKVFIQQITFHPTPTPRKSALRPPTGMTICENLPHKRSALLYKRTTLLHKQSALLYKRSTRLYKRPALLYKRPALQHKRSALLYKRPALLYKRPTLPHKRTTLLHKGSTLLYKRSALLRNHPPRESAQSARAFLTTHPSQQTIQSPFHLCGNLRDLREPLQRSYPKTKKSPSFNGDLHKQPELSLAIHYFVRTTRCVCRAPSEMKFTK